MLTLILILTLTILTLFLTLILTLTILTLFLTLILTYLLSLLRLPCLFVVCPHQGQEDPCTVLEDDQIIRESLQIERSLRSTTHTYTSNCEPLQAKDATTTGTMEGLGAPNTVSPSSLSLSVQTNLDDA